MNTVFKAIKRTFKHPKHRIFALLVFALSFFFSLLINHIVTLIAFFSLHASINDKVHFLLAYTKSVVSISGTFALVNMIVVVSLLTINIVMFMYLYKHARGLFGAGHIITTSTIGFVVSLVGIGCFSCGAFILAYILSVFGVSSLLYALPLQGGEIVIVGIIILCVSIYALSKKLVSLSE